jgi:TonB-dependent SusC/RagA subfamily outer membrane receptor
MGLDRAHYESVVEMLRGQVPGLEILEPAPGRIEVRIRGMTQSLQTNAEGAPVGQEPLVVVDGVPRSRPAGEVLLSLNPKDVASISVLKDLASTAIYGTKGANGVIVVRMRRTTT